ncbi:K(+)-transporting ATPase subunit C [Desnuesiella massiliensis]|uniref:K(+)-transporting ATPase subunit C n=1 Tax=Desnuesiella massiliensis TaxID=1650662 RepID=UPI0006E1474C|nr:K(+)-transporting ATPase subunit C [Desnuesiella massiliensis]
MKILKQSIIISVVMLILCGLLFPLAMTGISQLVFNKQANGSMIEVKGKKVGSELIGQSFTDARFFRGRVSAVNYNTYTEEDKKPDKDGKVNYAGVVSGSQNLAPSSEVLKERVAKDIDEFLKANPTVKKEDIPGDLLTSSGSGLDPHISLDSAKVQMASVSKASGIGMEELNSMIEKAKDGRDIGVFGEERVNVLKLNLQIANKLGLLN